MTYTVEHFGSSLGSWTALTSGTGTMTVSDHMAVGTLNASSDAAAIYKAFDPTKNQIIWINAAAGTTGGVLTPWPAFRLIHSASAPAVGARNSFAVLAQHIYYNSGGTYYSRMFYTDSGGTVQRWNEAAQAWSTSTTVVSTPAGAPITDFRITGIEWDATNSRMRLMTAHTVSGSTENPDYGPRLVGLTDWIALTGIQNGTSSTLWLVIGSPENNFYSSAESFGVEWISETTGTDRVHVYANNKDAVGGTYNITHHTGYDIRAPYLVPGTRAQIAIDVGSGGAWDDTTVQWGSAILAADGKYVQSYSGNAGGGVITVGIATATSPFGSWTKYASNPVITLTGSTDYSDYIRFNVLVEDWQESDSNKRYKLIVCANDGSTNRTLLFYAAAYTGPYTLDGRFLEDDATETQITMNSQPVWDGTQWIVCYNTTVSGIKETRYATCATLRAGMAVKSGTTLIVAGQNAAEVTLSAVSGRTWTCSDTSALAKDMVLICTQTSSADTYDTTRVRKIISSTQFEVYHSTPAAASGTVCRSVNYGNDLSFANLLKIGGVWYLLTTPFQVFDTHPSYSAHVETTALFVGGANLTDAFTIDWMATPVMLWGRDAWNNTISLENPRPLHTPLRIYTLTADPASFALTGVDATLTYTPITGYTLTADAASFTLTGQAAGLTAQRVLTAAAGSYTLTGTATALTAQRTLAASVGAFTLTGVDAGLTYTPVGSYTLTADTASFTLTGVDAGLLATRLLSAGTGAFTLAGVDAGLVYTPVGAYTLTADAGAFALSGIDTGITVQRVLSASAATFVLTGIAATLTKTGAYALTADAGSFTLTGRDASLVAARQLAAAVGAFTLTGNATTLTYSGSYRGMIRLSTARGPSTTHYPGAGPALRLTPVEPST